MKRSLMVLMGCLILNVMGCGTAEVEEPPFNDLEPESLLVLAIDTSGSFLHLMAEDARGYAVACKAIEKYLTAKRGTNSRLVILQLSGQKRSVLFDGNPTAFKKEFDQRKFRDFLYKNSDPNGSAIYDGLSEGIRYVLAQPGVRNRTSKVPFVILSDMDDNASAPGARERLREHFKELSKCKGAVGLFGVPSDKLPEWQQFLDEVGIPKSVQSDVARNPTLPNFD